MEEEDGEKAVKHTGLAHQLRDLNVLQHSIRGLIRKFALGIIVPGLPHR
jgi:hypothetical protein